MRNSILVTRFHSLNRDFTVMSLIENFSVGEQSVFLVFKHGFRPEDAISNGFSIGFRFFGSSAASNFERRWSNFHQRRFSLAQRAETPTRRLHRRRRAGHQLQPEKSVGGLVQPQDRASPFRFRFRGTTTPSASVSRTAAAAGSEGFGRASVAGRLVRRLHFARSSLLHRPQHQDHSLVTPSGERRVAHRMGEGRLARVRGLLRQPHHPSSPIRASVRHTIFARATVNVEDVAATTTTPISRRGAAATTATSAIAIFALPPTRQLPSAAESARAAEPVLARGDTHLVEGLLQGQSNPRSPPQVGPFRAAGAGVLRGHVEQTV